MHLAIGIVDVSVYYRWTTDLNRAMDGADYMVAFDVKV
jgi:hypothetical protein